MDTTTMDTTTLTVLTPQPKKFFVVP
ncbi:MAG: hypothetical protein ACD_17C00515G0001, partial [uncultured bacterium]